MIRPMRAHLRSLVVLALALLVGCAVAPKLPGANDAGSPRWQGRMAVKVHTEPPQQFSASFELLGTALNGTLTFTSILGNTLAQLQWAPTQATLTTLGEPQRFDSLASLTRHVAGTDLPVESLFAWLSGRAATAQGWQANLDNIAEGRINAQRQSPEPAADLRIVLEQ
ncbi:MAG: hypothetical protein K9K38_05470 [Rhodoferax sp.]|nr:hypothetical protein [Rhodoferax sp.]MCF8208841.1 hypothetical protein [Rhodoferax sp.]